MRLRVWMVVIASIALCLLWSVLFVDDVTGQGQLTVYQPQGNVHVWKLHADQVVRLLVEIGATVLAAVAVGILTGRKKSGS